MFSFFRRLIQCRTSLKAASVAPAVPSSRGLYDEPFYASVNEAVFETFKENYKKDYNSTLFANPFSKMKKMLYLKKVTTYQQVLDYAHENPGSRTARLTIYKKY